MIFGKKDGMFFVNSGHGQSRDWVDEHIPKADFRGAVQIPYIQKALGLKDTQIDNLIVGKVSIRKYVEDKFGYQKVQANQIVKNMDFLGSWKTVDTTLTNSVDTFVNDHKAQAKKAHTDELIKGRTKRWPKK